jgi:DNA-binding MarR family transcriptional regulator
MCRIVKVTSLWLGSIAHFIYVILLSILVSLNRSLRMQHYLAQQIGATMYSMVANVKPDGMRAWRAFLDAQASILRRLEAELVATERMTLAEYDVLFQLGVAGDRRLRMTELSDRVRLSRSGLTRLVDRLVDAGLVTRGHCDSDRRGTFAVLTPAGVDRVRRARPVHLRGVRKHFVERLSPAQLCAVADALGPLGQDMPEGRLAKPVRNQSSKLER